jgi:hypothetical protein
MDKKILLNIMYNMFSYDNLQLENMEDYQVMWEALIKRNNIVITDENWQGFIEDINCQAANKYSYFEQTFERYFY